MITLYLNQERLQIDSSITQHLLAENVENLESTGGGGSWKFQLTKRTKCKDVQKYKCTIPPSTISLLTIPAQCL